MSFNDREMKIFSGSSNVGLAKKISENLGVPLGNCQFSTFSDGEINIKINETVRGRHVFIMQSTCNPVNDNLMELFIAVDAFKRASAKSINAIIPYYGYARQDRKARGRDPITAKLVANLLTEAGLSRVLTTDLHSEQIQGFFDIPLDNLYSFPVFSDYILNSFVCTENCVVVSPDIGGVKRANKFATKLGVPLAILDKRRPKDNFVEIVNVIGDLRKVKTAIFFDDIIDTGRSLVEGAGIIKKKGIEKIYCCATHGVLSGKAKELIQNSVIDGVFITDTIPHAELPDKFYVVSLAELLSEAISRVYNNESISIMFE